MSIKCQVLLTKAPNGPDQWSRGLDWSKLEVDQRSMVRSEAGLVQTIGPWSGPIVR